MNGWTREVLGKESWFMKILYIHQYFTTREGTLGTRSYEFAKHLSRSGHEVTILTGDAYLPQIEGEQEGFLFRRAHLDGIEIVAVKVAYSNYMGFFRRVLAFFLFVFFATWMALLNKRVDLILATSTPLTVAIPALIVKKLRRIPFVFEVRDLWPEAPIQIGAIRHPLLIRLLRGLEKKTYQEASHLVALSPGMAEGIRATGIPASKITMIPNCADLDLFDEQTLSVERLNQLKEKYALDGKLVLLHGGSLGPANGLGVLIEAAIHLHQQGEDRIVFLFAGEGKMRPELEERIHAHQATNVYFTGPIPRKEMPYFLTISDITITSFLPLPILATNSPNKFFDSLAAAKPVIVNSNGWTKEIVETHEIGFYVDPQDPIQLVKLLQRLITEQPKLQEMGQSARKLAEDQYERGKLARQMEQVLLTSIGQSHLIQEEGRMYAK